MITINVLPPSETPALAERVTVYPVPASAEMVVEFDVGLLDGKPISLALVDASGQEVWRGETRDWKTVVPLQSVKTGTYSLRIRIGEQQAVKRLLKL